MDKIEHRIEQLHLSTSTETDRRILNDAFVALQTGLRTQRPGIRQRLINSRLAKPLAAAAVILVVVGLFINSPVRRVETVEDFYRNLGGVSNICVSTFEPGQTSPIQQVWTSQDLKVRLFKTGIGDRAQFALVDLANKVQTTGYFSNFKTEPLTEEKLRDLQQSMTPSFALAPFFSDEDVPKNAQWHSVSDPAVTATNPGCKVYELLWEQKDATSGEISQRKWRVFVDEKNHLPKRTESYVKTMAESDYRLEKYVTVTYPTESDIREIVANNISRHGGSTGDTEYIGTPGYER